MTLARMSGVALWRQIEQEIEADIRAKQFGPGDRLPTEADLAQRFAVNRHTVRRAMLGLQERGLIRVEQGRGSFVQENVVDYRLGRRTRFSENILTLRRDPSGELVRVARLPADKTMAHMLNLRAGEPVLLLETLKSADGRPINLGSHHFPFRRFNGLAEAFKAEGSITAALRKFGVHDYTRKVTRVTARMPEEEEARLLAQPRNRPVLITESVNVDESGTPIEYGLARFAADRVQFVFES
ncbi:MAG: phosphonate metabolism transcriptional regulator PhnF [Alphaproteobacteria bacterium]